MNKEAIEKLEATKLLALVFDTYREETLPVVIQAIKETFENINEALALLAQQPKPTTFTKEARTAIKLWDGERSGSHLRPSSHCMIAFLREACDLLDETNAENEKLINRCGEIGVERDVALGENAKLTADSEAKAERIKELSKPVTEHPDVQRLIAKVVMFENALQLIRNENFSGQSTLSAYAKRQADEALKGISND